MCKIITFLLTLSCCIVLFTGCNTPANETAEKKEDDHGHEHAHPEKGPQGGRLIEFGREEYHGELVHDDANKSVTLYLLDSKAVEPVAVTNAELTLNLIVDGKPQQAKLTAAPQAGDKEGEASRFTTTDDLAFAALEEEHTTGRVNVTIGDKSYTGEIQGGHEHEHK